MSFGLQYIDLTDFQVRIGQNSACRESKQPAKKAVWRACVTCDTVDVAVCGGNENIPQITQCPKRLLSFFSAPDPPALLCRVLLVHYRRLKSGVDSSHPLRLIGTQAKVCSSQGPALWGPFLAVGTSCLRKRYTKGSDPKKRPEAHSPRKWIESENLFNLSLTLFVFPLTDDSTTISSSR